MVNQMAVTAGLAFAVFQGAKSLPSPFKEVVLALVCVGALVASSVLQQGQAPRKAGPSPPKGWRWLKLPCEAPSESNAPEILEFVAPANQTDATNTKAALGIAIVPGNPGIPHFYCDFGERLQEALVDTGLGYAVTVYVVGYPNFSTAGGEKGEGEVENTNKYCGSNKVRSIAAIDEESDSIGKVLGELGNRHSAKSGGHGLVVLGHSIGAWIVTQHLLSQCGGSVSESPEIVKQRARDVRLAILAMPYLEYDPCGLQLTFRRLFALPFFPEMLRFVALTLLCLPAGCQEFLARRFAGGENQEHAQILLGTFFRQPNHLPATPLLAKTELSRLDPGVTEGSGFAELKPLLDNDRPPILALYTRRDSWAPESHCARLRDLLKSCSGDEVLDLGAGCLGDEPPPSHSFVLSRSSSAALARLVASRISVRLGPTTT